MGHSFPGCRDPCREGTAHRAQVSLAQGVGTHCCSSKSTGKQSRGWHKGARRSRTTLVRVYCEFLKHCVPWQWDCCGNGGKSPSVGAVVVGAKVEVSRTQPPPAAAPHSLPRLRACGAEGKCWGLLPAWEASSCCRRQGGGETGSHKGGGGCSRFTTPLQQSHPAHAPYQWQAALSSWGERLQAWQVRGVAKQQQG